MPSVTERADTASSVAPRSLAVAAALLGLTVLAYSPSLTGEFVWDDVILIRDNAALATPASAWNASISDFFQQSEAAASVHVDLPSSGYRRPVPTLLNAVTLASFGPSPLPFRLSNLIIHGLCIALVMALCHRLGLATGAAGAGAAIFALHPVNTEAVAFVSGRTDLLAALFCPLMGRSSCKS